jgi:glycosyltransferase involved in cell wall biosynthesis
MSAAPAVTVLSSIYNDAPFLRQAIESVLSQTFTDFEYLIINDAAIDDSRAIAASYSDPRIRLIDNDENLGLTCTLNRGLSLARGELIARFDSNDLCFPERLALQTQFLRAHPDVAAVGVQSRIIDGNGRRIRRAETRRPTSDQAIQWYCMFDTPLIHPGSMYRRRVVHDELGGYNEAFTVGQDSELWPRIARRYKLANIDEQLIAQRFDPRSISGDTSRPIRSGHRERWIPLAREHMRWFLEWDDIPEEWARLWVNANQPQCRFTPGEATRYAEIIERCFRRFCELHPGALHDREIAAQRVYMLRRAAEKAAAVSRVESIRTFVNMLTINVFEAAALLPRLAVLWAGGEVPLRMWRSWVRR